MSQRTAQRAVRLSHSALSLVPRATELISVSLGREARDGVPN